MSLLPSSVSTAASVAPGGRARAADVAPPLPKVGLGFEQIWRGLLKARWEMLTVFVSCVVTATVVVLMIPKTYEAGARVILEIGEPDTVTGQSLGRRQIEPYIVTQMLMVNDLNVGRAVAKKLGWLDNPDIYARWQQSTGGVGEFDLWAAQIIASGTNVTIVPDSNIMEVSYRSGSLEFSQQVAVLIRQAYIDAHVKAQQDAARRSADLMAKQLIVARDDLNKAEATRAQFQAANGIVMRREGVSTEDYALAALQASISASQAAVQKHIAQRAESSTMGESMSQSLERSIAKVDATVANAQATVGSAYPGYQALLRQQQELHAQQAKALAAERDVTVRMNAASQASAAALHDNVDVQKDVVQGLSPAMAIYDRLQRDVTRATNSFNRIAVREASYRALSERSESDLIVMGDAIAAPKPVFPNVPFTLGMAVLFGSALAIMVALLGDILAMRVRSRRALELATNTDVLVTIGDNRSPPKSGRWRRLFVRNRSDDPSVQWQLAQ